MTLVKRRAETTPVEAQRAVVEFFRKIPLEVELETVSLTPEPHFYANASRSYRARKNRRFSHVFPMESAKNRPKMALNCLNHSQNTIYQVVRTKSWTDCQTEPNEGIALQLQAQ